MHYLKSRLHSTFQTVSFLLRYHRGRRIEADGGNARHSARPPVPKRHKCRLNLQTASGLY
ncbi:hypothetical protein NEILACOT_03636 [Neisseria lactamica ATCC 23970]|uniref:Uncharacterized protein n=1 Tax=Neisseria lactamica ATCC 23970 TaxID=546265 RepID=D0W7Y5_NEILA|nr:hypothetical protein NEILACOT_03636 [Neisseria lactamica ATCC 23970]